MWVEKLGWELNMRLRGKGGKYFVNLSGSIDQRTGVFTLHLSMNE